MVIMVDTVGTEEAIVQGEEGMVKEVKGDERNSIEVSSMMLKPSRPLHIYTVRLGHMRGIALSWLQPDSK